jgi:hypothetical protein
MRQTTSTIAILATAVVGFAVSIPVAVADDELADAVKAFNALATKNDIGKDQPALTEAEVVAAIRGWIRNQTPPATDEVYEAFQKIAETGQLPKGAKFSYTTGWIGYRGYDFDVWWVDLSIMTGEDKGYTYRIRDRKINSRPTPKAKNM